MAKIVKTWHTDDVVASMHVEDENGVRNGECRTWNADGRLETKCNYVNGKIIGAKTFFGHDGVVVREIDYDFEGCPFVIRFYADDFDEQHALAIGLAGGIEELTLDKITTSFENLRAKNDTLEKVILELRKKRPSLTSEDGNTGGVNHKPTEPEPKTRITFT